MRERAISAPSTQEKAAATAGEATRSGIG